MGRLTREDLLKKQKLRIEKVDLGGGDFVYVTEMTGQGRDKFEQSLITFKGEEGNEKMVRTMDDFRAKLAVNTVCDENGKLLFHPEDYKLLSQNISATRLERIVNKAQELSKISEQDVENMVKNSKDAQNAGSISD